MISDERYAKRFDGIDDTQEGRSMTAQEREKNVSVASKSDGTTARDRAWENPPRELVAFSLRCARTANGLSHYYMYGDVAPEESLL